MRFLLASVVFGMVVSSASFAQGIPEEAIELWNEGQQAYYDKKYAECGELYAAALKKGAPTRATAYNASCCFALAGDTDTALAHLKIALDDGWRDPAHLAKDNDLDGLRDDPRFAKLQAQCDANHEAFMASINTELYELYDADQTPRHGTDVDWDEVRIEDAKRRERVLEIVAAGGVLAAYDHFHAAMVLQHGDESEHYKQAHELAVKGAELDDTLTAARWLAAAAKDRYLQSVDQPQVYGTQFNRDGDGPWTMEPFDPDGVTDEERVKWNVPALADTLARLESMNAQLAKK